jgi:hypothetical protein
MDEKRRFRFLVAPILFFASLTWGAWLDPDWRSYLEQGVQGLPSQPIAGAVVTLAGGGIALFASGFVIGTLTYCVLRGALVLFPFWNSSAQHEVRLPKDTSECLWNKLHVPGQFKESEELYLGVTFDHGFLSERHKGVHEWLMRRWGAFALNCTSVTALILSLLIGCIAGIRISPAWGFPVIISTIAFATAAIWSWQDTMGMLSFQVKLYKPKDNVWD